MQWLQLWNIKSLIDHEIYIKIFSDGTVPYSTVSTDCAMNTTNIEKSFTGIIKVFEYAFDIKFQEVSILNSLNFRICKSPLGFNIYHTGHMMDIVKKWFPTENIREKCFPP